MKYCILILFLLVTWQMSAQVKADGYIGVMPSWYHLEQFDQDTWDNVIHHRLNLSYDFSSSFVGVAQFRNRLIWGDIVEKIPGYVPLIDRDEGRLDMSYNIASGNRALLNLKVDRLWLDWYLGKLQIRAGRQRINWGQAMVWNPNDIFNAYSFFDFDYPERPGIDGLRVQFFTGMASQMDAVFKLDRNNRKTMALRYRFNAGRFDWQALGGRLNDADWVAGAGWSGHISNAGFYGEGTLLVPDEEDENEALIINVGADYTFRNSLLVRSEFLYSSHLHKNVGDFSSFLTGQASVRNLSVARYSLVTSVQYPFTPLFSGTLSAMSFPGSNAWYVGPSLEYSLKNNIFLSLFLNWFGSDSDVSGKTRDFQGAVRLKWYY